MLSDFLEEKKKAYRRFAEEGGWILEIVDERWDSTVLDGLFPSAQEALDEGTRVIEDEGIGSFVGNSKAWSESVG
jgi:hypothetical protein